MVSLFKKPSKLDKLNSKYKKMMQSAMEMSKRDRAKADVMYAEADLVLKEIEALEKNA